MGHVITDFRGEDFRCQAPSYQVIRKRSHRQGKNPRPKGSFYFVLLYGLKKKIGSLGTKRYITTFIKTGLVSVMHTGDRVCLRRAGARHQVIKLLKI